MQSGSDAAPPPFDTDAPTMTQGVEAWTRLCEKLAQKHQLDAEIIALTGDVLRSGTIERIEGMPLDQVLALTHRMPLADRSMLLTAADVLGDMPVTLELFVKGTLSWGQVRGIVAEAKTLSKEQRAVLDATIGGSAELFARLDPDDALDAVRLEVKELRGASSAERAERNAARANFLFAQPGLFNAGRMYAGYDNVSLAAIIAAADAAAPPDDGRSLAQRRADGLLALALHRCDDENPCGDPACSDCGAAPVTEEPDGAGSAEEADGAESPEEADVAESAEEPDRADAAEDADGADAAEGSESPVADQSDAPVGAEADGQDESAAPPAPRPPVRCRGLRRMRARPDISVLIDLKDVTATVAGRISINAPGTIPAISAALLESLAGSASVRAVLMDGGRPLAVGRKVWAKELPRDIRLAVKARDRADRFPGSRRPLQHVHHADREGEGHHPDHLVGLSDRSHDLVHKHGWKLTLDPATGAITFTRGERSWTTLPRGTRLRRPPPPAAE